MQSSLRQGGGEERWPVSVNRKRGEVGALIDGRGRVLCLTLGAMAELEDAFASEDVGALVQRLGSGRLSARDIVRIIGAGLRGAGEAVSDAEVAAMRIEGGTTGAARLVAELLAAAFGDAGGGESERSAAEAMSGGSAAAMGCTAKTGDASAVPVRTAGRGQPANP